MPVPIIRFGRAAALTAFAVGMALVAARPASAEPVVTATTGDTTAAAVIQARSLAAKKDVAGAIRVLQPYVAAMPRDAEAGRYLGDLYLLSGDLKRAEHAYLDVTNVVSTDRETHERLGNLYARQDRLDEAISQFERVLPDTSAFADLVRTHKRRGDLAAFVESYKRATETFPPSPVAQFQYGIILVDLYQPQNALPYLFAAAGADARSCPVETELGNALVDVDRIDEGIAAIDRCLSHEPNDYDGLVALGVAQTSRDAAAARTTLDRAMAVRPPRSEAVVDLGFIDDQADRRDAAMALFTKAIALDPFSRAAYVDLGYDQLENGNFLDAETTFLRGLSVSSGDGRIQYLLAETFERQGKSALARAEYRDATHSEEPDVAAAAVVKLQHVQ